MSITPEERERLWHLFQACDTDSDGLVNSEDIRLLCSRSELSDYRPEEIMDLFDTLDVEAANSLTFEQLVNKKVAHDGLSQMSVATSLSSDYTLHSVDDSLVDQNDDYKHYLKPNYRRASYKCSIFDQIGSLSEALTKLQMSGPREPFTYRHQDTSSSGYNSANKSPASKLFEPKRTKKFSKILPEEPDLSDESKKKFEIIRQDYINCLNELSEENENICEQLDRMLKERNYLRQKLDTLREEFLINLKKNKDQWQCERRKLEEKIVELETYITKMSFSGRDSWYHDSIGVGHQDELNENGKLSQYSLDYPRNQSPSLYRENYKMHQLSNKISELALFLSEIISNLRNSEIGLLVANCRASGLGKSVNLNDEEEEDEIMRLYERAMLNRNLMEREAVDFILGVDKEILIQYLSPADYQRIFASHQLTFDHDFEKMLHDMLTKLKQDLRQVNRTLDLDQSDKFSDLYSASMYSQQSYNGGYCVK